MDAVLQKFCLQKRDRRLKDERNQDLTHAPPYVVKFSRCRGIASLVAVGYENGKLVIEDTTGSSARSGEISQLGVTSMAVFDLDWSDNCANIALASSDKNCHLVRVRPDGIAPIGEPFRKHTKTVKCVKWLRDSDSIFASGGRDSTVIVWDTRVKAKVSGVIRLKAADSSAASGALGRSPRLTTGRKRTRTGKEVEPDISVQGIEFQDDRHMITVTDRDPHIKVWDLRRSYVESRTSPSVSLHTIPYSGAHSGRHSFVSCVLDPHLSTLYVNATDNTVYAYDAINFSEKPLRTFTGHRSQFMLPMDISCDGSYLATTSIDKSCVVWDLGANTEKPAVILRSDCETLTGISCHNYDPSVLAVSASQDLSVWRIRHRNAEVNPGEDDVLEYAEEVTSEERTLCLRQTWKNIMFYNQYGDRKRFRRYREGQGVIKPQPPPKKKEIVYKIRDPEPMDEENKENVPVAC